MKKDKTYGTMYEVEAFAILCDIKTTLFIRKINNKNFKKDDKDEINSFIFNKDKKGNFAIILDEYTANENKEININHYKPLISKKGHGINDNELNIIKRILFNINQNNLSKSKEKKIINEIKTEKIISGKTGKPIGSRMGKNEFNLYCSISRKNDKIKKEAWYAYKVNKTNVELKEPVKFEDITKCINLSSII